MRRRRGIQETLSHCCPVDICFLQRYRLHVTHARQVSSYRNVHGQKRASCSKSVDIFQQTCYSKPISGCVRVDCDSLLTTSLLEVINVQDLLQVDCQKFVIYRLAASCFNKFCK